MAADLGPRIAQLRLDHGLSQEALANKLGVSRQAVSRWECGETLPDTENLIALADLFEVSLDELVKGPGSEHEPVPEPESEPVSEPEPEKPTEPSPATPAEQRPPWLRRAGIALIFIGIALIFIGSILRFIDYAPFGSGTVSTTATARETPVPVERTEDILVDGITAIDIAWPSGEIAVVAWPSEETNGAIRIHEDRFDQESEDALLWEIDRGTLRISADPAISYIGETSITIAIPFEAFANLSSVSAEVLDGSINVQDIVPAALSVAVRNGAMQVDNVDVAELRVEQGAGEAHVIGRFGVVDARISGDADAELTVENSDALSISAEVTSGRLALLLPEDMGFTVTQQIDGPSAFETGFPIAYDEAGGHVGNGGTAISLRLGEGNVAIMPV